LSYTRAPALILVEKWGRRPPPWPEAKIVVAEGCGLRSPWRGPSGIAADSLADGRWRFAILAPEPSKSGSTMKDASLPVTLIVLGVVWLIWHFGWFPDRDWIIALGFMGAGVAVLVIDRITKSSVVIGPFLIAIGIAWAVRYAYRASWSLLIPLLLILLGVLMLVARNPRIPDRRSPPAGPDQA
jgi:hypothetical protein